MMVPLVLAVLLHAAGAAQAPMSVPTFDEALVAAGESIEAPGGEAYQKEFGKKSSKYLGAALDDCLGGPAAVQSSFQILLKLEADGKVGSALVRPEGPVTACVRDKLSRRTFPKPPAGSTWKLVNVRLGP